MDESAFNREMNKARELAKFEPERARYWEGFQRGLRRQYFGGDAFGTEEEHARWQSLAGSDVPAEAERGQGYGDGLVAGGAAT